MNKTPVSILQEMMAKKGSTPSYELIFNGGGTHQNTFTFQVTCDGLTANGTGRSKKDAKHEAAKAMLDAIIKRDALPQLTASPAQSPIRTPLPKEPPVCPRSPANVPFRNTIGELQDLCGTNNLDEPQYKEISEVGPPHDKIFTVQCIVSTFVEEGVAKTKKNAKHEAARKMIDRITDVISDDSTISVIVDTVNVEKEQQSVEKALDKYLYLSESHKSENIKLKINWGLKIQDYSKFYKDSFITGEEIRNDIINRLNSLLPLIEQCKMNYQVENFMKTKEIFQSILDSIDIQCYENHFENNNKEKPFIVGLRLNTAPDICEMSIGTTKEEALISALERTIKTMLFLLH